MIPISQMTPSKDSNTAGMTNFFSHCNYSKQEENKYTQGFFFLSTMTNGKSWIPENNIKKYFALRINYIIDFIFIYIKKIQLIGSYSWGD